MGSLMAGWDSPILDDKKADLLRNRSYTQEEINEFWRIHNKAPQENEKLELDYMRRNYEEDKSTSKLSNSPSLVVHGIEYPINLDIARKSEDWWTRSEWAFLNEPPLDTALKSCHNYTPQFHVAQLATQKYGEAK